MAEKIVDRDVKNQINNKKALITKDPCSNTSMGESFQDYFWIQDFEADVSLKMLN